MAENQTVEKKVDTDDVVERAKDFWAKFSKPIIYIGGAVIAIAAGWIIYNNFIYEPKAANLDC